MDQWVGQTVLGVVLLLHEGLIIVHTGLAAEPKESIEVAVVCLDKSMDLAVGLAEEDIGLSHE